MRYGAQEAVQSINMNSSPDQPLDPVFQQKLFARRFGGKSLRGTEYELKAEAERIRFEFLKKCSDPALAARVIQSFGHAYLWIRIGRYTPEAFEKKATKAFRDADCMDHMIDILRYHSDTLSADEIKMMDAKVNSLGIAYISFLDGR